MPQKESEKFLRIVPSLIIISVQQKEKRHGHTIFSGT